MNIKNCCVGDKIMITDLSARDGNSSLHIGDTGIIVDLYKHYTNITQICVQWDKIIHNSWIHDSGKDNCWSVYISGIELADPNYNYLHAKINQMYNRQPYMQNKLEKV